MRTAIRELGDESGEFGPSRNRSLRSLFRHMLGRQAVGESPNQAVGIVRSAEYGLPPQFTDNFASYKQDLEKALAEFRNNPDTN